MDWNIFMLVAGILAVVIAIAIVFLRVIRSHVSEAAERKRVSKILHSYAIPRSFKVLDNATLISEGNSGWADHIVVGHFGILLVYDLCWGGAYYGGPEDEKWTLKVEGKGTARIDNPLRAHAGKCTGRINTLLKNAGMKVPVESAVVVTGISKDTVSYIKAENIVRVKLLRKYLSKTKFEQDRDVDVEAVTAVLTGALKQGD